MTLASLVVEMRKRATGQPQPASVEHAIAVLMGLTILPGAEAQAVRAVLVALARAHTGPELDEALVDSLGPLATGAFDRLFEAMLDGSCTDQMLRELLKPSVVRRGH
jgi:hypothetical protein